MVSLPTLELTFRNVAGNPWEGEAVARFQGEPGEPFPVREGLTAQQRKDLRWYVEDYVTFPEGGYRTRARRVERQMEEYGRALWQGVQGPQVQSWLGAVQASGQGRLELRAAAKNDEIAFRSPWELLRPGDRLLHQFGVTVVRRTRSKDPRLHLADTSKGLRVLMVVCRPEGTDFLDPRYTPRAILDALASRPEVRVDFCRPGSLKQTRRDLQAAKDRGESYHVLHFDGHGTTLANQGGVGALCFEKTNGDLDLVEARRFGELMAEFDIPLVVLEACRTSMPSFAQETVASELLRRGVGTVIAMGHAVHVDMTRILMGGFYEAVTQGTAVGEALRRARNDVLGEPGRRVSLVPDAPKEDLQDWFVPQLYQGGEDPVLLESRPEITHTRPAEPDLPGFPPPPQAGFAGRGRELHRLERAVHEHSVAVLHGFGGTGKTALAREAAHWWTRTGWFEGAIFVSFEGRPSVEKVVYDVGVALEGLDFHKRPEPAAWVAEKLAQRRWLVVWDNFESMLLTHGHAEGPPPELVELAEAWTRAGSRILVTSRSEDVVLPGAHAVDLGALSDSEALSLLAQLLDKAGVGRAERQERDWDVDSLTPLIERTGGHPLALELVAPHVAVLGPDRVVEDLGPLLAQAEQEHGEIRNRSLTASLEFSIQHLSEDARDALPAVALMSGGCVEAMARLTAGLEDGAWDRVKGELERTGLVRVHGALLHPHPVLADVKGLAPSVEVEERFFETVQGLCGAFHQRARSKDPKPALAALAASEVVARRAVDRALEAGRVEVAWVVADSLKMFLGLIGRSSEGARLVERVHQRVGGEEEGDLTEVAAQLAREAAWARASRDPAEAVVALQGLLAGLEAVEDWDSRTDRALTLTTLARVHYDICCRPKDALSHLERAEEIFEQLEKEVGLPTTNRAAILGDRANVLRDLGRYEEALAAVERGEKLNRSRDDTSAAARSLASRAHILRDAGQLEEAEQCCREALRDAREAGDNEVIGMLCNQLGSLANDRNRFGEAEQYFQQALLAFQQAGDELSRMFTLNQLGMVEHERGNLEDAQAWYEGSRTLAEKLKHLPGKAQVLSNVAVLYQQRAELADSEQERSGWLNRAIDQERQTLAIKKALGQPNLLAISHSNLANSLCQVGQFEEAEEHAREAQKIFEQIRSPQLWRTLWILEGIAEARGDESSAAEWRRRKEVAYAEARERAGQGGLGLQMIKSLLQLAYAVRTHGLSLREALAQTNVTESFLDQVREREPWLLTHLQALAGGEGRPSAEVPALYTELVDAAWKSVED